MAANSSESFLAVASHSLALKRNSCIKGNRMYPSQNNFLPIQTFSIQIHGSQSRIAILLTLFSRLSTSQKSFTHRFCKKTTPASEPKQRASTKKSWFKKTYHFCINYYISIIFIKSRLQRVCAPISCLLMGKKGDTKTTMACLLPRKTQDAHRELYRKARKSKQNSLRKRYIFDKNYNS